MSTCKITEPLQDILLWLASTTDLPPWCYLGHFEKKMLVAQIECAYSANNHDLQLFKYFVVVKYVSFFF